MSNNNNNNGNNNGNRNQHNNGNDIEKMNQKGQVGQKPEHSGNESMQKGASQGHQGKPMQQGKPAHGQHQGGQKPEHSGNNGDIKKYSTHQEENDGLDSSDEFESNKK